MKKFNINQLLLLLLFISTSGFTFGQVDPQIIWQKTIGANDYDKAAVINQTADGGYIIGNSSLSSISGDKLENSNGENDYWIIKTDNLGAIVWQNTIGGNHNDMLKYVEQTSDGGYIVAGTSSSNISGDKVEDTIGLSDIWIVKLSSTGVIDWQNTIGGSLKDKAAMIHQTPDGGYIVGGTSRSNISGDKTENSRGSSDYWIIKLNALGIIDWQKTYGGAGNDVLTSINKTSDGGYIVGGISNSGNSGDKSDLSYGFDDYWVLKLNATGAIVWQKGIGGSLNDKLVSVSENAMGNFILGGYSNSNVSGIKTENSNGAEDFWFVLLNTTGSIIWQNTIGGSLNDKLKSIHQKSSGGYILAGTSNSPNSGDKTSANLTGSGTAIYDDEWIVSLNDDGSVQWNNSIGSVYSDQVGNIIQTSDGEFVLLGQTNSFASYDLNTSAIGSYDLWITKLRSPSHSIYGNIFLDFNLNCIEDSLLDGNLANKIILDGNSTATGITNSTGNYNINTYSDTALLFISNLSPNEHLACVLNDTIPIYFDSTSSIDTSNIDYLIHGDVCSNLSVTIASSLAAPCRSITYNLNYYNAGFDTARNAIIYVDIDSSILTSISSTFSFTQAGDSLLFPIGNIAPYQGGTISFTATVNCSAIIGTSICTRAYTFPISNCPPPTAYDSSDIVVDLNCIGDSIHATIKNRNGAHAMSSPGLITVIEDEIIQSMTPFTLGSGAATSVDKLVGVNKTFTIEVAQHPNHPQRPIIIVQDELCALAAPIKLNTVINHFSRFDDTKQYEEVCTRILASFDPNLKSVIPEGYTSQHYTDSNQIFEYRIDFQNTGLDTARKVVIIDTLSPWLDITTFVPLVASNSYTTQLENSNIVKFIFDPISLPDSNASEINSHGYVTFKIRPKFNTPKGTVINNFADIYFDYNAPVRTNTVFNTIYDTVLVRIGLGLNDAKENMQAHVLIFPNPTIDKFFIKLDQEVQNASVKLIDATGREVYELNQVSGRMIEMKASHLQAGIYFIQIYDKQKLIGRSKIVVQ